MTGDVEEYQPVRIARAEKQRRFHLRDGLTEHLMHEFQGTIVRVRPAGKMFPNDDYCPDSDWFEIHPDDAQRIKAPRQYAVYLCEHQIEAD